MTKNLTLRLDEEIIRRARRAAVDQDLSVSGWVGRLIAREVGDDRAFARAAQAARRRLRQGFHLGGEPFKREELYDR